MQSTFIILKFMGPDISQLLLVKRNWYQKYTEQNLAPEAIKNYFMLNSAEREIPTAHETKMLTKSELF